MELERNQSLFEHEVITIYQKGSHPLALKNILERTSQELIDTEIIYGHTTEPIAT